MRSKHASCFGFWFGILGLGPFGCFLPFRGLGFKAQSFASPETLNPKPLTLNPKP